MRMIKLLYALSCIPDNNEFMELFLLECLKHGVVELLTDNPTYIFKQKDVYVFLLGLMNVIRDKLEGVSEGGPLSFFRWTTQDEICCAEENCDQKSRHHDKRNPFAFTPNLRFGSLKRQLNAKDSRPNSDECPKCEGKTVLREKITEIPQFALFRFERLGNDEAKPFEIEPKFTVERGKESYTMLLVSAVVFHGKMSELRGGHVIVFTNLKDNNEWVMADDMEGQLKRNLDFERDVKIRLGGKDSIHNDKCVIAMYEKIDNDKTKTRKETVFIPKVTAVDQRKLLEKSVGAKGMTDRRFGQQKHAQSGGTGEYNVEEAEFDDGSESEEDEIRNRKKYRRKMKQNDDSNIEVAEFDENTESEEEETGNYESSDDDDGIEVAEFEDDSDDDDDYNTGDGGFPKFNKMKYQADVGRQQGAKMNRRRMEERGVMDVPRSYLDVTIQGDMKPKRRKKKPGGHGQIKRRKNAAKKKKRIGGGGGGGGTTSLHNDASITTIVDHTDNPDIFIYAARKCPRHFNVRFCGKGFVRRKSSWNGKSYLKAFGAGTMMVTCPKCKNRFCFNCRRDVEHCKKFTEGRKCETETFIE